MTWLVTGGAGYIGAHVVRQFLAADIPVTVLDDLSTGQLAFIPAKVSFTRGTVLDGSVLERVFGEHSVTGVVHLAGSTDDVGSVMRPLHTFEQNVDGTSVLLAAMQDRGVKRMVFTSTLAVYGMPTGPVLTEEMPPAPRTPFGESKLVCEWLLRDQTVAAGLHHTTLRLPEVIGTAATTIFDPRSHAPLAALFEAAENRREVTDDPAARDYVDADDVARTILEAVKRMDAGQPLEAAYNLGSGSSTSAAELRAAVERASGITLVETSVEPESAAQPERAGPRVVASGELAARDLDWRMRHPLDEMVAASWAARRAATPA